MQLVMLGSLARQRQEELCREAEFRQRHRLRNCAGTRETGRLRRRLGHLLVGAGNRLIMAIESQ